MLTKSPFSLGAAMVGKPADSWAIILHRGHVVIDLVGGHFAVRIQGDLNIGQRGGSAWTTGNFSGRIHCTRVAHGLRENHCFVFGSGVAAVGSAIVARSPDKVRTTTLSMGVESICAISPRRACGFWLWV